MDSAGVNATVALVRKVISLGKKATNLEYEEALLAARETLSHLREQNLKLKEEKSDLQVRIKDLEFKTDVHPEKGHEWLYLGKDEDESRRYCPNCYYAEAKLIPLEHPQLFAEAVERLCPTCTKYFK